MNTEEVTKMIDAITEGKNYTLEIKGDKETGVVEIVFTDSRFYIKLAEGWGTEHTNPRIAREIAGALIVWANRKEKNRPSIDDDLPIKTIATENLYLNGAD